MSLILEMPATSEPVLLTDVKQFLKIDDSLEDILISSIISAARVQLETYLNIAFMRQLWALYLDELPQNGIICLKKTPILLFDNLSVYNEIDGFSSVEPNHYSIDLKQEQPQLKITKHLPHTTKLNSGIRVQFWAGYGSLPADLPTPLKLAMLNLIGHYYENRSPVMVGTSRQFPANIMALIAPYRKLNF